MLQRAHCCSSCCMSSVVLAAASQHNAGLVCPLNTTISAHLHVAHMSMPWTKWLFRVCTGSCHMARAFTMSKRRGRLLPQLETLQSSGHLHQAIVQSSCPGHLSCQGHHE